MSPGEAPANDAGLRALYRDTIRRHAADPTGYRKPLTATHVREIYNPQCGDRIELKLRLQGEAVEDAAFDGEACAICLASASLLCGLAPGETAAGVRRLAAELETALGAPCAGPHSSAKGVAMTSPIGETPSRMNPLLQAENHELPVELHALLGVRPYPSRVRCATLPWEAAAAALNSAAAGSE